MGSGSASEFKLFRKQLTLEYLVVPSLLTHPYHYLALVLPVKPAVPCIGATMSRMVRLLERRLDAVAQGPPSSVKLFPDGSSVSPSTGQPTKKLQVSCANGHGDNFLSPSTAPCSSYAEDT